MVLSQVNDIATQLNLPCHKPITRADIKWLFVAPPGLGKRMFPSAVLQTSEYYFSFTNGKLHAMTNTRTNTGEVEHYREWASMAPGIGTNEAYQLATQWLCAVSVDVAALERRYKPHVSQRFYYPNQQTNIAMLPLFHVEWGDPGTEPIVRVGVFGPTKQTTGFGIEDQSFLTRTNLFLTNDVELNNIPDPPRRELKTKRL